MPNWNICVYIFSRVHCRRIGHLDYTMGGSPLPSIVCQPTRRMSLKLSQLRNMTMSDLMLCCANSTPKIQTNYSKDKK